MVLDAKLIGAVPVTAGLKAGGTILINSARAPEEFDLGEAFRTATVDASGIAAGHGLGTKAQPIVNSAMVGAFAAVTGLLGIESVMDAVRASVPVKQEEIAAAARDAFHKVRLVEAKGMA